MLLPALGLARFYGPPVLDQVLSYFSHSPITERGS